MKIDKLSALAVCTTICSAVLSCSFLISGCANADITTQPAYKIVQNRKKTRENIKEVKEEKVEDNEVEEMQEEPVQVQTDNDSSVTNIDNSVTNIDNSVTNIDNSVTNIDNSVTNIDNSTIIIENGNSEDDEIVIPEKKEEECVNVGNNRLIPVGDEKNDIDPNPNVVLIKNAECPKCGEYSYIEQYNKRDVYFQHYIGMCKSCNFEY